MNIVGQLAETVFVTVKELYRGLNPATLTGGIDVIVVRQPDGSFQCSPFHVRFGKLGVLRSKEKIVDIEINGESVDLHMKLGDNGEAFFVEENENMVVRLVPAHLCTSPLPLELPEETAEASEGSFVAGSGTRRKKRRRKRVRSDTHLREDGSSSSEEREREKEDRLKHLCVCYSKSVYYSLSEEPTEELGATQTWDTHPHSEGEQSPSESTVFYSRPSSPKSDSELLVKPLESSGPQIQWNWGGFPTLCQSERTPVELQHISPSGSSHFRAIKRQDSFELDLEPVISCGRLGSITVIRPQPRTPSQDPDNGTMQNTSLAEKKNLHVDHSTSSVLPEFCTSSVKTNVDSAHTHQSTSMAEENRDLSLYSTSQTNGADYLDSKNNTVGVVSVNKPGNEQKQLIQQREDDTVTTASPSSTESTNLKQQGAASEQGEQGSSRLVNASARVAARRNHHLGPTDIYLDDLTTLDPEMAALYFPKSEAEAAAAFQHAAEQASCSGSQSPQSVGSGAMDSGTEYLSDSTSYNMDVSMSLCGQEGDTSQITKEKFMKHIVTYQEFAKNPGIIEDPNLVICINSNYYNWAVAAPVVLSMTAFQKNLPKVLFVCLFLNKIIVMSVWFYAKRKKTTLDDIESDEAAGLGRKATIPSSVSAETLSTTQCISQMYRKSLRLTSEQIENLNLREGANQVVFSVTTQYQGTCRCEAAIYLWNWDDRVIISDIDGTITKSDALGHILPQFGKDWTHKGIAKLYHKIHQNGYKFLYCSARAIGMAAITKNYLQWVNDKGIVLPKGPVLLAPSSLFSALHREVIEKKPEVFKVACLGDIRDLFNPQRQPFYAAFGNRTNDSYAYKQVGVPDTRIFTVNPKGELMREKTKGNKSSYSHLSEMVEHFFPVLSAGGNTSSFDCPEYSSFSYWKEPLPEVDLNTLL
uniref:phosphatidate phosphatase n=1 Tax=Anabas testudineus TaxID=64144 RepID=A0A3Q1JNU2_ANATE